MSSLPWTALGASSGFQSDPRFAPVPVAVPEPAAADDPLARAWDDGHAAGFAEASATAAAAAEAERTARGRIELALARLDGEQAELLRQKLLLTVQALCEGALAPLALDRDALAARIGRAAAMLARAEDDKLLRLHPDDLQLIASDLPKGLEVQEDSTLERGALRIETASGGVEDGPAHWRRAIAEALNQC
ncbi:MAG: FliH/SctL family protein [Novosphingobium sp.]